eukprot:TRINITY_DN5028_c0_g1_i1.p1 TRINITY_DN5028_c0_g1~~TRINITY_DN5028_c0_g1_i1.p1  ORF type:complete len:548 (-),score=111.20 TRINITY_DN5028_c0_g1_i1:17-1660(-)
MKRRGGSSRTRDDAPAPKQRRTTTAEAEGRKVVSAAAKQRHGSRAMRKTMPSDPDSDSSWSVLVAPPRRATRSSSSSHSSGAERDQSSSDSERGGRVYVCPNGQCKAGDRAQQTSEGPRVVFSNRYRYSSHFMGNEACKSALDRARRAEGRRGGDKSSSISEEVEDAKQDEDDEEVAGERDGEGAVTCDTCSRVWPSARAYLDHVWRSTRCLRGRYRQLMKDRDPRGCYNDFEEAEADAAASTSNDEEDPAFTDVLTEMRQKKFIICRDSLALEDQIGKGAYGLAFKGTICGGSVPIAVKRGKVRSEKRDRQFVHELRMMAQLPRHESLVALYGFVPPLRGDLPQLVLEFVPGGTLYETITHNGHILTWHVAVLVCKNIAKGMAALHAANIMHRDLKPANVLLADIGRGKVKICDFGFAQMDVPLEDTTYHGCPRTPRYAAPEILGHYHAPTKALDVYCFAVTMWEVMARQLAWAEVNRHDIKPRVLSGERPPLELCVHRSQALLDLITSAWQQDDSQRPSFVQLVDALTRMAAAPVTTRADFLNKF